MRRSGLVLSVVAAAVVTASCSAGFSKPRAEALVERDAQVFAFVDPDPNRNTKTTVARLQVTADGRDWEAAAGTDDDLRGIGQQIGEAGMTEECDETTAVCYRIVAPGGGLQLELSFNGGRTWSEVWSISAGRLEFQDRCCGDRSPVIRDLEYVPETGVVAVALGEYGLLTRGNDGQIRLDSLGRPDRPASGLMTGLYMEPLFAGVLALAVGWLVTEQRLHRVRGELEHRLGSADHAWLTGRARQVPIMLPFAAFLALGGIIAIVARVAQTLNGDPPRASGWPTLAVAVVVVVGVSSWSRWLHVRQWRADEETAARAHFEPAKRKALKAHTIGTLSALLTLAAALLPLIAWSTGRIDVLEDAILTALAATVVLAGGFLIFEATNPPLPD